jgi:hypothetical protein
MEMGEAKAGWMSSSIPTHRKIAMDRAPDGLWLVEENGQKQRRNAGVLRFAQNDKERENARRGVRVLRVI